MLVGVFVLPGPIGEKEINPQDQFFHACLKADIQQLHGCRNIADLFNKMENFVFQNTAQAIQLLVIVPPDEYLISLLRQEHPEIKLIVWSKEAINDELFKKCRPMIAACYHDEIDIANIIEAINRLITL